MGKVKEGDYIAVNYTGKLENEEVFDTSLSPGRTPLEFTVGAGQMIKGFDNGVIGMKVGETKTIMIPPAEGYGVSDPGKIITADKNSVPDFEQMEVGGNVVAGNGAQGKIIAKDENTITIDFNNKLAGKTLIFEVQLVSIN